MLCKFKGAGHCTSAKGMTRILRHVAEAFPPARQGTILSFHRVIGIATNTSIFNIRDMVKTGRFLFGNVN